MPLGDSLSGRRAAVILKNVGLNACADPFVEATTQGLIAGVVIVAGDDPLAEGSQNAQDSRYYGELAEVPVIEPGPDNIHEAVEEAFRASESFSRIVILRLTPDLLEAEVTPGNTERKGKTGVVAPLQLTMKGRVEQARNLLGPMCEWSEKSPLNRMNGTTALVGAAGAGDKPALPGEYIPYNYRVSSNGRAGQVKRGKRTWEAVCQGAPEDGYPRHIRNRSEGKTAVFTGHSVRTAPLSWQ